MNVKIVPFSESTSEDWDFMVSQTIEASFYHSWHYLRYLQEFSNVDNKSFAMCDTSGALIAIVPIGITISEGQVSMSFSGTPCGAPAFISMPPSLRRKRFDLVMEYVLAIAKTHNISRADFLYHPVHTGLFQQIRFPLGQSFELQKYGCLYQVQSTVVIDLQLSDQKLWSNLSKYRRRSISQSLKKGLKFRVYNNLYNIELIADVMNDFQQAHFKSAGRVTRSQGTWDAMTSAILDGHASLFVIFLESQPISYLLCGHFDSMAWGWSQVNIEKYERLYSPRHLLEWEAICYFKQHSLMFYEVGDRYYGPQFLCHPSPKEIDIGEFKERYGGVLLPKITWSKYFNQEKYSQDMLKNYEALNSIQVGV